MWFRLKGNMHKIGYSIYDTTLIGTACIMARMKHFENIGLYYEWGYACLCLLISEYCSSDILHLSWYSWTSIRQCRRWCWSPSSISDSISDSTAKNQNTGNERITITHGIDAMLKQWWWYDKLNVVQLKALRHAKQFNRGPRGGNPNLDKPRNASERVILFF